MTRRSAIAVSVLLAVLVSACHQAPQYTSMQASFVDKFDRPDTELGLGPGWDMRGGYVDGFPLPAATDGFIRGGRYSYSGSSVVYAARQMRGTVKSMGTIGSWRRVGEGDGETTMTMAVTPNDKLVADMVHFSVNRSVWELTVRRGAGFEPVVEGKFSPVLSLDRDYRFDLEVTKNSVTVRVPGEQTTANVDTTGLLGDRVFWEQYPSPVPSAVVFDYDTVWAVEDGQPLVSIAD
ncbi:hypothetical protein ACTJJE_15170 [Mycolicibacterium sp. 22603]|uniref:hypothetical protein n=1 Tax=Mycolicibacterium sp. 22603 TaxID=3453950 RepID=UPI003F874BEC